MKDKIEGKIKDKITASEAIFGFCGWITSRKEELTVGAAIPCGAIIELITEWCKVNNLVDPRDRYSDYIVQPKRKRIGDKDDI